MLFRTMNHPEGQTHMKRRQLISTAAALAGTSLWLRRAQGAEEHDHAKHSGAAAAAAAPAGARGPHPAPPVSTGKTEVFSPPGIHYRPVITPNGKTLEWK